MNDASDNNGSEGQAEGVAYATFGANAGVDQVIVMAKTSVIMAYADPKEMWANTKEVLSRCGPGFGEVKDLTLGTGAKAGVWSIAGVLDGGDDGDQVKWVRDAIGHSPHERVAAPGDGSDGRVDRRHSPVE